LYNFPIENTYNGFNVTPNYYSQGGVQVDGSLYNQIQRSTPSLGCQPPNLSAPFWSNLMATQQNLFQGWNGFGGCQPRPCQPQPQPQPQPPAGQCGETGRRRRVDVHVHHHFYQNGCGGPFTCAGGQGASSTSQTHTAFGSNGSCSNWKKSCGTGCYSPFSYQDTYQSFGYGNNGCYPRPDGYQGTYGTNYGGYQGSYGTNYGGYQGSYGNGYSGSQGCYGGGGSYGGYQGSYGNGYSSPQGCYGGGGSQGSYGGGYGGYQGSYGNSYQQFPTYNWGDFNACFGRSDKSAFGVQPSAYAGYAMTSPFTDMGTAAGIAVLGGALSMFF
jgi:hypothetical protein